MLNQDDPKKCTAARLSRFRIARRVKHIPRNTILLDPFASIILSKADHANSITALDCSWSNTSIFKHRLKGIRRRLPLLFAGNPINYAKPNKLSTAEALAAACIILGYNDKAYDILSKFKWGHTFLELNRELFDDYSNAYDHEQMARIEEDYINSLYGLNPSAL